MLLKPRFLPVIAVLAMLPVAPVLVHAQPSEAPVDLQADSLEHDEQTQIITASGNVMMVQSDRILRADRITYDLKNDKVVAHGNVVLNEPNGDVHFSQEVEFNDHLRNGFVDGLKSWLTDGSRLTAASATRSDGQTTHMSDAVYTPCEPCKNDPERAPVWQIKASDVTHHQDEHRISYKNARFELWGVPIAYTPYFSHPDGSIKRKSGLLGPVAGYRSQLGTFFGERYYWDVAPNKDMTMGVIAMTEEDPLVFGQWRQRGEDSELQLDFGAIHSGRVDQQSGVEVEHEEEWRGHIMADLLWDMNDKWRLGTDIDWVSDDQYIRQYDFSDLNLSNDDVLESQIYAERFSGRDYLVGRLITFQDVRIRENQEDQPEVLPEIIASFKGDPGGVPLVEGQWGLDMSFLGLQREGRDQDMNRFSVRGSWMRRFVSDYGLLSSVTASMRSDVYNTRDRTVALAPGTGQDDSETESRFYPLLHMQSSYPMVKQMETMQASIEPIVAITLAPNIDVNDKIPNEDSQDVQIDASNLFESNRFPGLDRVEDQSRVTYGVRTGLYGYGGGRGDVFIGQSHRFTEDDNPFPDGSGLDKQESDIVGQVSGLYKDKYGMDYRFQLASEDLSPQRHEVEAFADWNRFMLSGRYLFAKALEGTDIINTREQLQLGAGYYFSEDWRMRTGGTQDLGDQPGLRQAYVGLDYFGQCVSLSLTGERNYTDDSSGDSETEVILRLGLKNLDEFETSGYRPKNSRR